MTFRVKRPTNMRVGRGVVDLLLRLRGDADLDRDFEDFFGFTFFSLLRLRLFSAPGVLVLFLESLILLALDFWDLSVRLSSFFLSFSLSLFSLFLSLDPDLEDDDDEEEDEDDLDELLLDELSEPLEELLLELLPLLLDELDFFLLCFLSFSLLFLSVFFSTFSDALEEAERLRLRTIFL